MEKLNIKFKNCYGIKELNHEFSFEDSNVNLIYAKNGSMKTSFTKVFKKYQEGKENEICDEMFPDKKTEHNIIGINDFKENIFVIESYSDSFKSKKISTLLLKEDLKDRYESEYKKISDSESVFYEKLREKSKLKNVDEVKAHLLETFAEKDIFDVFLTQETKVKDGKDYIYDKIIYNEIFNKKAFDFLLKEKNIIEEYITRYKKLVSESRYLGSDFNHYRAKKAGDILEKMYFYKGGHKLSFYNKKDKTFEDILDEENFNLKIENEEKILFKDEELKKILGKLDKKIKNSDLEQLRDYLFQNKEILPELKNLDIFRKKIWIDYFKENINEYEDLLGKIKKGKIEIEKILIEAEGDKEYWKNAVNEFNSRFTVPFELDVNNIKDILTKNIEPEIDFTFKDIDGTKVKTNKTDLLKILSQGEKRALYLLNIIFEINARKESNVKTLFIIDDIADSFDYKNKYAIIEYLKEVSENINFKMIILTHNFDFYRILISRFLTNENNDTVWKYIIKGNENIKLIGTDEELTNPFKIWLDIIKNKESGFEKYIIATIPMIRELLNLSNKNSQSKKLQNIIHCRRGYDTLTIKEVREIFVNFYKFDSDYNFGEIENNDSKINELINKVAFEIVDKGDEDLVDKIILSLYIRKETELFLKNIPNMTDKNSFIKMLFNYKVNPLFDKNIYQIIKRVNIMTPENIHLNSFMYEPILDMDIIELKDLYNKVKELNN